MEDWIKMILYATDVIDYALEHRNGNILEQRIAVMILDQATELIMKAYLLKEDYLINEIDKKKMRKRGAKNKKLKYLLNDDNTIRFSEALELVLKTVKLTKDEKTRIKDGVKKFHSIRNEVQHRALEIPFNKSEEMGKFYPILRELYVKMFPEKEGLFPTIY